jgi:hypothetical protein
MDQKSGIENAGNCGGCRWLKIGLLVDQNRNNPRLIRTGTCVRCERVWRYTGWDRRWELLMQKEV